MTKEITKSGHCLCGNTRWSYTGPETWACFCHCNDCRRNTASPVTAFVGMPTDGFEWTGQAPATFKSSPNVTRSFCTTCGTPMAFQADHYADEIHLYAATLDAPETFKPEFHVNWAEKLPWLEITDDLPKYAAFKTKDTP